MSQVARGGMERQAIVLAGGLIARGHQVEIVALKRVRDYREELSRYGVPSVELRCDSQIDLRVLPRLLREVRRFEPDVVLCENFNATLWGRCAAALSRTPMATAEHTTGRVLDRRILFTNRAFGRMTSAVVACAEAQRDFLTQEGNPPDKIVVIRNGVSALEFQRDDAAGQRFRESVGVPLEATVIGLMAAHRPEKRHDRFLELIERLHGLDHDVWGLAVGGGPLYDENVRMVSESACSDRVLLVGPQADVTAAYSAMDVAVFVSDLETFPMAALEAQCCEVPIVSVDVGGIRESMSLGDSGFVVPPGDIEAMAELLAGLVEDRRELRAMGAKGRRWVSENLSVEAMVDAFEALLSTVARR